MLETGWAVIGSVVTILLAAGAAAGRALTPGAAVVAGAFGVVIVVFAGFGFLGILIAFVVVSSLATRYRFEEKRKRNVQEGRAGERGVSNVLAHIVLPTGLAVGAGFGWISPSAAAVLFSAALAFALADTLASEFGVLSDRAFGILTFRKVRPGTNGGVSAVGEGFAVAGALAIGLVGMASLTASRSPFGPWEVYLAIVSAAGFLSCQVDSVLGETLENRGYLTKGTTNFLGMLTSVVAAAAMLLGTGRGL